MPSVVLEIEDPFPADFSTRILDIFNDSIKTDHPITPESAAQSLHDIYLEHSQTPDSRAAFIWWFWEFVHSLPKQLPHDSPQQDSFVAVITALRDRPFETVELKDWGTFQLWRDQPLLAPVLIDKFEHGDRHAPEKADKDARYLSLNAYAARLYGHGLVKATMPAVWALSDALEGVMTPVRGAPDTINEDPSAVEKHTYKIAAAAAWITHAGHRLYGRDEEIDGTQGGPLWKLDKKEARKRRRKYVGTKGLCPQRWKLWKQRFADVEDCEKIDGATRDIAGDAITVMSRIEKNAGGS